MEEVHADLNDADRQSEIENEKDADGDQQHRDGWEQGMNGEQQGAEKEGEEEDEKEEEEAEADAEPDAEEFEEEVVVEEAEGEDEEEAIRPPRHELLQHRDKRAGGDIGLQIDPRLHR